MARYYVRQGKFRQLSMETHRAPSSLPALLAALVIALCVAVHAFAGVFRG